VSVILDRVLDWILDLLTTYTHDLELQVITVPLLISTIHKSPQHPLNLFQCAVSSPAIPWQWLLTVEILQLHMLKSSLNDSSFLTASFPHRLPYWTDLVTPVAILIMPQHGPDRNTPFPTVPPLLHVDLLLQERVYQAIAQKWPWYICSSCSRCIAMALHASIHYYWIAQLNGSIFTKKTGRINSYVK
jgi:hypothetical protein